MPIPSVSALVLTRSATEALTHAGPHTSRVAFAFTLNVVAKVRVTLAKRVSAHGHSHWQTLPDSRTVSGRSGRNSSHLSASGTLSAGRYRLTLVPTLGVARSLVFAVA